MIIINAKLDGEHTYDVTISENNIYRVSAFDAESAIDILADYLEATVMGAENRLYLTKDTLEYAMLYSGYNDMTEFVAKHKLVQCGTNNIYTEIVNIKEARI